MDADFYIRAFRTGNWSYPRFTIATVGKSICSQASAINTIYAHILEQANDLVPILRLKLYGNKDKFIMYFTAFKYIR